MDGEAIGTTTGIEAGIETGIQTGRRTRPGALDVVVSRPADVGEALVARALTDGLLTVQRSGSTTGAVPDLAALAPSGALTVLDQRSAGSHALVVELPGLLVRLSSYREVLDVDVVGEDVATTEACLRQVLGSAREAARQPDGWVRMRLWSYRGDYADMSTRQVLAPSWPTVAGNYAAPTATALAPLMTAPDVDDRAGRLVLWHGAPGTGKTTAVRALAQQWSSWCEPHYVTDPEKLFAETAYLLQVAGVDDVDDDDRQAPWRLVVAEDCDEYLRADAKQRSGASLGRLLNLCDGILGHGLKVVVLLTTNEDLGSLHPAITRPGRCLSQVDFAPLSPAEAGAWLGGAGPTPTRPTTLAELYALREDRRSGSPGPPEQGGYL